MSSYKSFQTIADVVEPTGQVVAMVSPFGGKPDLQGDVIDDKAYDLNAKFWESSGRKLPVLEAHNWANVEADLGYVERLEPRPGCGLVAHMQLDLTNPRAAYAYKLLRERRRVEFSIGYDPIDEQRQADGSNLLKRVNLKEISLVLAGAAADAGAPVGRTEVLSVKAAGDEALTLRSHLKTGHSVASNLIGVSHADMVLRHRLAHTKVPGASERHLRSGLADGEVDMSVVTDDRFRDYGRASADVASYREKLAEAVAPTKSESADVQATIDEMTADIRRKNAEAEVLRQYMLQMDLRAASMPTGPTLSQEMEIEAENFAREEAHVVEREAERAAELAAARAAEVAGRDALQTEQRVGTVEA